MSISLWWLIAATLAIPAVWLGARHWWWSKPRTPPPSEFDYGELGTPPAKHTPREPSHYGERVQKVDNVL